MMNNVSIYGVQGVDPMAIQDGMLSMLFESSEGFDTAMNSALLSTDTGDELLTDGLSDTTMDGLALMQSEMAPALMSGLNTIAKTSTGASGVNTGFGVAVDEGLTDSSGTLLDGDAAADLAGLDEAALMDVEAADASALQTDLSEASSAKDLTGVRGGAAAHTQLGKDAGRVRKAAAKAESIEAHIEEAATDREVSMEERIHKSMEADEELLEEWDSSHLQMEGEFDPIAANTPFARSVQMLAPEGRVTVQSDAMEAHEGESVKETAKTSDKKEAQKVFDSALELNELEENPADARVEISDQRTVRVVLDQELAVEVSQDGDAVDVVVEGAPDVTNDMRETAPEIASKLDESGLQLRDFSTRRESQEKSHSGTGGDQESASEVGEATPTETLARGRTVNVVA